MPTKTPFYIAEDAEMVLETKMFNGMAIPIYMTVGNPQAVHGWTENPRTRMVVDRWRRKTHSSDDVFPCDDDMLNLMLEDDARSGALGSATFKIRDLGASIKQNGLWQALIVDWEGNLLDGNRRKFAVKWALSPAGGASHQEKLMLEHSPIWVLPENTTQEAKDHIVVQSNYGQSLKQEWPQFVTNHYIYDVFKGIWSGNPDLTELEVRKQVAEIFASFSHSEIGSRVRTCELTEEFRAEYSDDLDDDALEQIINSRFQYFRQAHDTYKAKECYENPGFRELVFEGIKNDLFPSFAAVRKLGAIHDCPSASKIFLDGIGLTPKQKKENFNLASAEAYRAEAEKRLPIDARVRECVQFLEGLTSVQIASISDDLVDDLCVALERVIAQAEASADTTEDEAVAV